MTTEQGQTLALQVPFTSKEQHVEKGRIVRLHDTPQRGILLDGPIHLVEIAPEGKLKLNPWLQCWAKNCGIDHAVLWRNKIYWILGSSFWL